jgi:cytochrome c-type biogenesis protein CcmH
MSMSMYLYGSLLTLLAVALLIVPMLKHRREPWVTAVLCLLIVVFPLAVGGIYLNASSYDWEQQAQQAAGQQKIPSVDAMVDELSKRMNEEPDVEGWMLLGRSYTSIGRYNDAVNAWYEAWVLTEGKDPEVSISYAEVLIMADRGTLQTSAVDLLEFGLKEMPDDPRALWYGGLSAAARGQDMLAAERYARLLQAELPDEMRMAVQQQLAALGQEVPEELASSGNNITTLAVQIDITPELRSSAVTGELLFLIARDKDQPKPPVAVKRVRVSDFPLTLNLSDNDVMIPGKKLKNVKNLEVIARISKSNQAFAAAGDLYGEVLPAADEEGNLTAEILIDSIVGEE